MIDKAVCQKEKSVDRRFFCQFFKVVDKLVFDIVPEKYGRGLLQPIVKLYNLSRVETNPLGVIKHSFILIRTDFRELDCYQARFIVGNNG
jgi:hypothetical protein